jgi:hypothetical protein
MKSRRVVAGRDQGTLPRVHEQCAVKAISLEIAPDGVPVRLDFEPVYLQFSDIAAPGRPTFGDKNNKTLSQTLTHRRYRSLQNEVEANYSAHLGKGLGTFWQS